MCYFITCFSGIYFHTILNLLCHLVTNVVPLSCLLHVKSIPNLASPEIAENARLYDEAYQY
jgi:hypothetical protein